MQECSYPPLTAEVAREMIDRHARGENYPELAKRFGFTPRYVARFFHGQVAVPRLEYECPECKRRWLYGRCFVCDPPHSDVRLSTRESDESGFGLRGEDLKQFCALTTREGQPIVAAVAP